MKKLLFITFAAALLAGCASVGNNFDSSKVSQIKKGQTKESDLVKMFGAPSQRGINSEGAVTLTWIYSQSTVKGTTFIPIVGAFAGGMNTKNKTLSVHLNQSGTVADYDYSGGALDATTGIQSDSTPLVPAKSPHG